MAVWAYACTARHERSPSLFVARDAVDAWPPEVNRAWVQRDRDWLCVDVDRSEPVSVEGMLLRTAEAAAPGDCPQCSPERADEAGAPSAAEPVSDFEALLARPAPPGSAGSGHVEDEPAPQASATPAAAEQSPTPSATAHTANEAAVCGGAPEVMAAAVALHDVRMLVVLAQLEVVRSPGEADMLLADLGPHFPSVPIVLMGQEDDGTPVYHGDPMLKALLADVPLDRMPWKPYRLS